MGVNKPSGFSLGLFVVLGALLFGAAPAAAQVGLPPLPSTGPAGDAVMSDNVEYLGSIKQDIGLTTGARVIGDRMFVTSGKNISIYDISDPASPKPLGDLFVNLAWENEEVPTNGEVLVVSTDYYSVGSPGCVAAGAFSGCVQFFDVRDPANIREVGVIGTPNHTADCALDCQYVYGSDGSIIDARGVLNGTPPVEIGNWIEQVTAQLKTLVPAGGDNVESSCHHIREIRPGILLTACQPFVVLSIRAEDGGSPANPKVLSYGQNPRFVHSARWPRGGKDNFLLTGGELNATGRCENHDSYFSVYDARDVLNGTSREFDFVSEKPPAGNGFYVDGKPAANGLGCSVHWFQEHATFKNGGLVALSEYDNGVRFLQITKSGGIVEQGYFLSLGSSSSSPKWAGKDDVLYSIDYQRGIDILRWTGKHYLPNKKDDPGVPGTGGVTPPIAPNAAQAAQRNSLAARLRAQGWSPSICRIAARR